MNEALLGPSGILLEIGGQAPVPWHGPVVGSAATGDLCAQGMDALTVWAPAGAWWQAFALVAMCRSASPDRCLVLSDQLPPLDRVPCDGRVAVVARGRQGPTLGGGAPYTCADLRSDRVFRLLLTGRARRQPALEPLVHAHVLARTRRGAAALERWRTVLPVLFRSGLAGMMPEELRTDLVELAAAARQAEHAVTGGFHALDPAVRGPAEWESGARTYLRLAAACSPAALAAVEDWLDATAGWHLQPPACQERLRVAAARLLHGLVDDPWPSEAQVAAMLAEASRP